MRDDRTLSMLIDGWRETGQRYFDRADELEEALRSVAWPALPRAMNMLAGEMPGPEELKQYLEAVAVTSDWDDAS